MKRVSKSWCRLLSTMTLFTLILSSGATPTRAEVLSGENSFTLIRQPQTTPDGLGASGLGTLQYANPAEQLDLAQVPVANNQGNAEVSLPISVPPGRLGVQPDLALSYSSTGSDGWLGLGWDLPFDTVTIDTRWGVPRYRATQETETYLLDGSQLSPTAVQSTFEPRTAEKKFQRRTEGPFERIVRHGNAPGSYWWEVTDKNGRRRFYGGTPGGGRDADSILADASGHEYIWGIKQSRDIHGNTVTYTYNKPTGTGVGLNGISTGQGFYLASIRYTGSVVPNTQDDPAYQVTFLREGRPDTQVDARGGFLHVTSERLKRIVIDYRGTVVRSYTLNYSLGVFGKTLLTSIDQYGGEGSAKLGSHTFSYYDDLQTSGSTYHGFDATRAQDWNTQQDGVRGNVDLGSFGDGRSSVLGGTETVGGDGRIYLGFNLFEGSKEGSGGVGLTFTGEDAFSRLEMIDINGDNLPDKVFEQGGQVMYRLNQSGPNGTPTFSPGAPLPILGLTHLSRESSFQFSIGPELYFGVSVMFNHAWAWTSGKAYFSDVNADGNPDFVDQGTVYFNHLDANGNPYFSLNSSDTDVPIDSGQINPSLQPDLSNIEAQIRAQAPLQDVIRRWVAPWSGQVKVEGNVQLLQPANSSTGDGVRAAIQHEGSELWSATIPGGDYAPRTPSGVDAINVNRGDAIYFRLQSVDDGASDQVSWDPMITYLNVTPTLDANGLDVYQYQASKDFTLGGRSGSFTVMPLDGTVRVAGTLNKIRKTTDDVTIQVIQNGAVIDQLPVTADQVGAFPYSFDFPVTGANQANHTNGDKISLVLKIDSPIDLSAFSWAPRLSYLTATRGGQSIPVVDQNGQPMIKLFPPVDIQMYGGSDLTAPQNTWKATTSGSQTLTVSAKFCDPAQPAICAPNPASGTLTISIKKKVTPAAAGDPPSQLIAKKTLTITNGALQANPSITFTAEKDAEYYVDLSVPQAVLGSGWSSASISPAVPFARHWSYTPADVFPEAYRGWGVAGYNGDGAWGQNPIDKTRLVFDKNDYPNSAVDAPVQKDPNNPQPSYPQDFNSGYKNPAQAKAYAYAPALVFDANGNPTAYWRGAKDDLNASAAGMSSSRLGPDSITMPTPGFAGARGVIFRSTTEANAIAGGLGGVVGGSYAWGSSKGLSDFLDLNGDSFPDILGNGGAQYTTPRGGLEAFPTPLITFDSIRKDSSTTKTFSSGGDAAEINADSKGQSNTAQKAPIIGANRQRAGSTGGSNTSPGNGDGSQTTASLGISGELGWSSTNTLADNSPDDPLIESDLADMNGDGLPDRVRLYSSGRFTVNLNLGYSFDLNAIDWPGGRLEQGKSSSVSVGPAAGFSYGDMSFSGGVALSSSTDRPLATWVDLNGDGLPDQVYQNGGVIRARFNTGANLAPPVDFGSWLDGDIARAHGQTLGGQVDFTIGIGPLCYYDLCYLIINPGVGAEGGMTRQEVELKDIDGDSYPDHLLSTNDGQMRALINQTGRTNLLKTVTNPIGGSFTIDYSRTGNTTSKPYSQWVMGSLDVNDGRPGDGPSHLLTTYQYAGGVYNPLERDYFGYDGVTEQQRDASLLDSAPNTPILSNPALDQQFPVLRSIERDYRTGTVFDKGLVAREAILNPDGSTFQESLNSYTMWDVRTQAPANLSPDLAGVGLLRMSVFPQQVRTEFRRYNGGAIGKTTWNTYTYDALGNVTQTVDVGEPDLAADDLVAATTYTSCTGDNQSWLAQPISFTIQSNGTVMRSRQAVIPCDTGEITHLAEDTGSGSAVTDMTLDSWGNYNHIVYPANERGQRYTVDYTYDDDTHSHIIQTTDSFGLVSKATYDNRFGQVASRTDPNGQVTSYTYDAYSRLSAITGPYEQGTGKASATFEYSPTAPGYAFALAHNFDVFHPGDPIDTATFIDGLGRQTQTKQDATIYQGASQPAANRAAISGRIEFDALGREVKQWYPSSEPLGTLGNFNPNPVATPPTVTSYDILDRVTRRVAPNNAATTTVYGFDTGGQFGTTMYLDTTTDPMGRQTSVASDVRGNQLALAVNHTIGRQVRTYTTLYRYDPLQQLIQVTDAGGNKTTHEYDLLGRRTATTTPDGGRVTFTYDLASQLIAKVTPNLRAANRQIHYTYDFTHLTGITYTDGTPNVAYTYGSPSAPDNAAGRITQVTDGARVSQRAYGRMGELTSETTTMLVHNVDSTAAKVTWTTQSAFETLGRIKSVTYPDGEVVSYAYDSGGMISAITGVKGTITYPYTLRQEYDEFFARRFVQDGNQVMTETSYDPLTRWVSRQTIDAPGRRIQDLNYTYDLAGNELTEANNSPVPVAGLMGGTNQQTFQYDDLYRLTSASGSYTYAPGKVRSYTQAYTYDDAGLYNIVRKTQTDSITNSPNKPVPQQKTTYDLTYTYGGTFPHQATRIGNRTYTFDLNGNLTGWADISNGQNRTVTWDAENRVTSVADQGSTTTYTYTDENRLGLQRGPQGETAFVNRYYTVRNANIANKEIWSGDQRIVTKQQMPPGQLEQKEFWLHSDLRGSTNLVTTPTGSIYEHLEYFPSGETWVEEHSDIFHVPFLYTGGYYDEFRALYNFGLRWYEPREQFLYSTEPALVSSPQEVVSDPALLSAYTSAEDNSLRFTDPDGHIPIPAQNGWVAAKPSLRYRILRNLDPEQNTHAARFKAFATFKFPAVFRFTIGKNQTTGKLELTKFKISFIKVFEKT